MSDRPLGRVQRHVLMTLGDGVARRGSDWAAWYPLDTEQVRGALERLGLRGLVDTDSLHGGRTFKLTAEGHKLFQRIVSDTAHEHEWGSWEHAGPRLGYKRYCLVAGCTSFQGTNNPDIPKGAPEV